MTSNAPVWTALDLTNVRTDILAGLDLTRGPAAAVLAVRQELATRRQESRLPAARITRTAALAARMTESR